MVKNADISDISDIVKKISLGEEKSFRRLFDMYYSKLFKISYSYLRNKSEAEETVADVFLKLWQIRQKLPKIENIDVYLYVAVRNQSFQYLERRKKTMEKDIGEEEMTIQSYELSPEQYIFDRELKEHLDNVIDALPPRCREIFKLAKIDGLKYKDIAEMLGVSVKTIDNQLVIALRKISESIDIAVVLLFCIGQVW